MEKIHFVLNTLRDGKGDNRAALDGLIELAETGGFVNDNQVEIWKNEELMTEVVKICAEEEDGGVKASATKLLWRLARPEGNRGKMFKFDGLVTAVVNIAADVGAGEARVNALTVLQSLACAVDNNVPMFKLDGLMNAVVKAAG